MLRINTKCSDLKYLINFDDEHGSGDHYGIYAFHDAKLSCSNFSPFLSKALVSIAFGHRCAKCRKDHF